MENLPDWVTDSLLDVITEVKAKKDAFEKHGSAIYYYKDIKAYAIKTEDGFHLIVRINRQKDPKPIKGIAHVRYRWNS